MLVTLVAALAIAPGPLVAAPANNEYSLDLPAGDGGGQDPTANASGASGTDQPASGGSAEGSGSTATGSGSSSRSGAEDDSGGADDSDSAGGSDDSDSAGGAAGTGGSNGGGKPDAAPASEGPVESTVGSSTAASDSDDGGVSIFLIIIAVLAAAAVGLAIWRIRSGRSDGDVGGQAAGVNPGA